MPSGDAARIGQPNDSSEDRAPVTTVSFFPAESQTRISRCGGQDEEPPRGVMERAQPVMARQGEHIRRLGPLLL